MDLKEGSLDAHVALGPLSPDQVRSLVRQVLVALSRLHRDNQIHGALRPANLRLDADGNVTLGAPSGIVPGRDIPAAGPAKYLAPELLKTDFGAVGPGADLYCLGFTALELLAGPAFDALFPGVGPHDIDVEIAWMRWHSSPSETLPPTSELISGLPTDLGTVLDRLLKNVQDRYASAAAALRDLEATPPAPVQTAWKKKGETSTFAEDESIAQPKADWRPARGGTKPSRNAGRHLEPHNNAVLWTGVAALLLSAIVGFAWLFLSPEPSDKIAVTIASFPPHAQVFIDDKPLRKATDTTYELPRGEYTLRLELENYEPFEGKIGISEGRKFHKVTLNKVLVKIPDTTKVAKVNPDTKAPSKNAEPNSDPPDKKPKLVQPSARSVRIASIPKGASVYINDVLQNETTDGDYEVDGIPLVLKVVHKGLAPEIRKIDDASQLDKTIEIVFDRAVTLRTDPSGATLFLDGKEHPEKSPAVVILKPGKHQVKAIMAGYAPEEKAVVVALESKLFQEEILTLRALNAERHALLIGVREGTKDLPSFVHAESDAETLARTLQVGGFKADKVAVLTQTRGLARPDELPTAMNIKQRIQGLAAAVAPQDILVVALIGHVVEAPAGAYFCPADANLPVPDTLVSLSDVLDALAAAPAQRKLLILDCWRKDWKNADKLAHIRAWDKTPPPGVTILYGCAKGQTGYEHPTSWHGAFNYYLIQGLLGEAGRTHVTGALLGVYCKRQVSKLISETFREADQVPVLAPGQPGEAWGITSPAGITDDYLLGCSLLEQKAYEKAVEAFNRAEHNLPGFVELYLRRAEAHYRIRQFEPAMRDCKTALNLDASNADAYASLAESQAATKDYISAGKNGVNAIDLDPQCALACDALGEVFGTVLGSGEDYDLAVKYITKAINLQPELFIFYHNRGVVHRRNKQWDKAIADFGDAIRLNDRKAILFADRGNAWRQKKNSTRAIADYSEAINLDSSVFSWWLSRLIVQKDSGALETAIVDLETTTKLKGANPNAWITLGIAYREKKMYDKAVEALNQALRLDPNDANAKRLLKEILERK